MNRGEEAEVEENNVVTKKLGNSLRYTRGHVNERQVQDIIVIKREGSRMSVNTQNTFKIKQEPWKKGGVQVSLNWKSISL